MTDEQEIAALRASVALHRVEEMACLRFSGRDAYEIVDWLCPAELYLRHSQMRHTLLLNDQAFPVADLYVACYEEDFLLLFEGLNSATLEQYIQGHLPASSMTKISNFGDAHQMLSLQGPFAWELLSEVIGAEIVGLPYLTFAQINSLFCFRAGNTGEYGYLLMVPKADSMEFEKRLVEIGQRFDLAVVGKAALDQCALENFYFNIRREGSARVTPIELQLQWRVSYRKKYVGADALAQRRQQGASMRLTCLVSREKISIGDSIFYDEHDIGEVVNAGFSCIRGDWVALVLLKTPFAYPGIARYCSEHSGRRFPVRTVAPPVINNRSLHINPQIHSFASRSEYSFPPLVT
jgi:glycine cleavage system aminomethyltransferase T